MDKIMGFPVYLSKEVPPDSIYAVTVLQTLNGPKLNLSAIVNVAVEEPKTDAK